MARKTDIIWLGFRPPKHELDETTKRYIHSFCPGREFCDWPRRVAGLVPSEVHLNDEGLTLEGDRAEIEYLIGQLHEVGALTGRSLWEVATLAIERGIEVLSGRYDNGAHYGRGRRAGGAEVQGGEGEPEDAGDLAEDAAAASVPEVWGDWTP